MTVKARLVKVDVRQGEADMVFATVHGRPGVFVSVDGMDNVQAAIAAALENAFAYELGEAVFAVETEQASEDGQVWVILPADEMRRRLKGEGSSFSWLEHFSVGEKGGEVLSPLTIRSGVAASSRLKLSGSPAKD